jgi:hypothetical protein
MDATVRSVDTELLKSHDNPIARVLPPALKARKWGLEQLRAPDQRTADAPRVAGLKSQWLLPFWWGDRETGRQRWQF